MKLKTLTSLVASLVLTSLPLKSQRIDQEDRTNTITYEAAVENPALRPSYISSVCKRINVPTYVKKIEYTSTQEGSTLMQTKVSSIVREDRLDRSDSDIEIMPLIFSNGQDKNRVHSDAEFIWVLEEHEFEHAKLYNNCGRPIFQECMFNGKLDMKLFEILSELEAHDNEVKLIWGVNEKGVVRKPGNERLSFDYAVST
jgi:hypothetical protein